MDWKKAVNYIIIFLVLVNAVLFGLNVYKDKSVTVGQTRRNGIITLLEKNGIALNCSLPSRYSAMTCIGTGSYTFDPLKLRDLFFPQSTDVIRTDENDKIIFADNDNVLTIDKTDVSFTEKSSQPLTGDELKQTGEEYVKQLNVLFGCYEYADTYAKMDGTAVIFYEKSNGYYFFNNYFMIFQKNDGTREIKFSYRPAIKINGEKNDIIASDEAVYSIIDDVKKNRVGEKSIIQNVALGYYDKSIASDSDSVMPCYKIIADGNEYYVNAVTGES